MKTETDFAGLAQGRATKADGDHSPRKSAVDTKGAGFMESQSLIVKAVDPGKRQITALASAATLDRHNEIILPTAFAKRLHIYMESGGVVITSHQHVLADGHSPVIGNTIKAWIDNKGLWVIIEFIKGTELSDEYWMLYSQKKQRALSVGFIGIEGEYREVDGKRTWIFTEVELVEISCVPVGSNREAISKAGKKGAFVQGRRAERQEEKELAEIRAEYKKAGRDFDGEADEFARMLLGVDADGDAPELQEGDEERTRDAAEPASLVRGGSACVYDFAGMVSG